MLGNAKVGVDKHDTPAPTYKGLKNKFCSTYHVVHEFCLSPHNNKHYEWWQEKVCATLAYNNQRMAGGDRYQSLKGGDVGPRRR